MSVPDRGPDIPGFVYQRPLGSGGFADVHLYQELSPRRLVAIKIARADQLSPRSRDDFIAEANAMAALVHPHIVSVHSVRTLADGRPYLVMAYYPGANLREQSIGRGLPLEEVLRIGIQIGSAVETAHRAGVLHCDIKPANVLTSGYGPGLTDFGIAARIDAAQSRGRGLSVAYAAPEVILDVHSVSVASDVYSLGATLWALLVGRSPFEAPHEPNDDAHLISRSTTGVRPPTRRSDVPATLEGLLRRCLSVRPEDRPTGALNVILTLQVVQQELRLPLTPLALDEVTPHEAAQQHVDTGTNFSGPLVITSGSSAPGSVINRVPADLVPGPGTGAVPHRERVPSASPRPPDVTVADAPPPVAEEQPPPAKPLGRGRRYAIAGTVLAVVVAGAVVTLHGIGSPKSQAHATSSTASAPAQDAIPDSTPGIPVVAAQKQGSQVLYSWTYNGRGDGDAYRWRSADLARSGAVTAPTLSLPSTGGAGDCLEVLVVRPSGAGSGWSTPACPPG